jgi:hypothetical protein
MIDYSKSFSFMFEDKNWAGKIFLGAVFNLLSLVLIGIPFVLGYLLELAKNASEGKEVPLPQWDKLGEKFMRGLIFLVIIIIYSIPSAILYKLPCSGKCLSPLYSLALLFVLPWITLRYASSGKFEEVFNFKEMFRFVQKNINSLIIVVLLSIALGFLALLGILALVVGIFFTAFWANLAVYYLYGKVCSEEINEKGDIPDSTSELPSAVS